jgi:hypothetical protein
MPVRPSTRRTSPGTRTLARVLTLALAAGGLVIGGGGMAATAAAPVQTRTSARVAPDAADLGPAVHAGRAAARAESQRVTVKVPSAARTGSRITVSGTVSPARAGLIVSVQRRYGGSWHAVGSARLSSKGTWSVSTRTPKGRGWLRYRAVAARNGALPARAVEAPRVDNYTRHTYVVRKRGTITVFMKDFAAQAAQTYADRRGWRAAHHRFTRVSTGGDFTLVLAEARYLPSYSSVCSVRYSCRVGRYVVINQNRWRRGSSPFTGSLRDYRHMVVNHETGHWLGRHHEFCGGKDKLAPVMQQQSKSLQGCRPNAWPLKFEIAAVA